MKNIHIIVGAAILTFAIGAAVIFVLHAILMGRTHAAVKRNLLDLDSARFNDEVVKEDGDVCGCVNAKNGFGGYAGVHRYYYSPLANIAAVEGLLMWPLVGKYCE